MMRSNKLGTDFSYVILDDDSDMLYEQSKYFICCDPMKGLTLEQANKAIEVLFSVAANGRGYATSGISWTLTCQPIRNPASESKAFDMQLNPLGV